MTTQQPNEFEKLLALEGWRGLCALIVAVLHLPAASHITPLALVGNAHLFVDFFFVLSGFVLSHAYMARLETLADARFMIWRRIARLWPLHVALLLAFIALEISGPVLAGIAGVRWTGVLFDPASSSLREAIPTHLLLLHSFGLHDRLTWNIPSWSIAAEFWTYVVFAAVMVVAPRLRLVIAVALAAGGALVVILYSKNLMATHFDLGFFRCLYGFFVGHLVYRLASPLRMHRGLASIAEIGCVVGVVALVSGYGRSPLAYAAPLLFGVVISVFARSGGLVSDLLGSRPFVALGTWSYSIYMVHALLVALVHRLLLVIGQHIGQPLLTLADGPNGAVTLIAFGGPWIMDLVTLGYLAALIFISALTWRWIEMPAQRYLNGKHGRAIPFRLLSWGAAPARREIHSGYADAASARHFQNTNESPKGRIRLGLRLANRRYFVCIGYGVENRNPDRLAAEGQSGIPVTTVSSVVLGSVLFFIFGLFSFLYLLKSYAGLDLFSGNSPLHPLYALFLE